MLFNTVRGRSRRRPRSSPPVCKMDAEIAPDAAVSDHPMIVGSNRGLATFTNCYSALTGSSCAQLIERVIISQRRCLNVRHTVPLPALRL
jgi:hypothetical protein